MNLTELSASRLSLLMREGVASSLEVTLAHLERIRKVEPDIRGFILVLEDLALNMARRADEMIRRDEGVTPVTGIPVAIKDLLCLAGYPATCGSKILEDFIPPYSATVVERLARAGAVFIGKTNMDEFAMGSSTENSRFFVTGNPWDTSRVPGGSSGGSAAAVASGMSTTALGTDTGGSIRQPAAFCGITGLKPTYGRVSRYGLVAFASSLDQIGPMTRTVEDSASLLSVIAGHDPMDSTCSERPVDDYIGASRRESLKDMVIGMPVEFFSGSLPRDIVKCLDDARTVLQGLGARFVDVSLPSLEYSLAAYYVIAPSEASSNLARYDGCRYGYRDPDRTDVLIMSEKTRREGFGPEVLRRIMMGTYALSSGYYEAYYQKAQKARTLIRREYEEAFLKCQLIFAPATPSTAFGIGEKIEDPLKMYLSDIFTVSVNLAGLPALVVPCGFSQGLPVGMQFIGRAFDEVSLLGAGGAFQRETDHHLATPSL